ncbi:hypothetical protein M885DRAFT_472486 [Pelagophyceae sp. CCMP2097]|nr:hypothetical protein M885DRAFT_472486 [Pelagophyceae sp. CCMP2097]
MASLILGSKADYLVHDAFTVETEDHEDHTFNGVMFDVVAKRERPVAAVVVDSVWVRGGLGKMTVWHARGGHRSIHEQKEHWTLVFEKQVPPSQRDFVQLKFAIPAVMRPGERHALYVHSADEGDQGVVYDAQREIGAPTHDDDFIRVHAGLAHISPEPFAGTGPWWGPPWRRPREFVGRISYGARYVLWEPRSHACFSPAFQRGAASFFAALAIGWRGLPSDVVLYIVNMARWDWFECAGPGKRRLAAPARGAATPADAAERRGLRYESDYARFDAIESDSDA